MELSRWRALTQNLGVACDEQTFSDLLSAYSEPHRHYHNQEHISDCLAQFDRFAHLADNPAEAECALWFHDAVYKIGSASNERDSACWARDFLQKAGAADDCSRRVYDFIMATRHDAAALRGDAALVVDIDLSILGREEPVYARFERNIRKEYRRVPGLLYRARRRRILESFLARESIYFFEPVRASFESAARRNLRAAIDALS